MPDGDNSRKVPGLSAHLRRRHDTQPLTERWYSTAGSGHLRLAPACPAWVRRCALVARRLEHDRLIRARRNPGHVARFKPGPDGLTAPARLAPSPSILYALLLTTADRREDTHAQHRRSRAGSPVVASGRPSPHRMTETRFWLIRHALVDENARAILYGVMDVALCETTLLEQEPMYRSLAAAAAAPGDLARHPAVAHPPHRRGDLRRRLPARRPRRRTRPDRAILGEWQGAATCRAARAPDPAEARLLAAGRARKTARRREHGRGDRPRRRDAGTAGGRA